MLEYEYYASLKLLCPNSYIRVLIRNYRVFGARGARLLPRRLALSILHSTLHPRRPVLSFLRSTLRGRLLPRRLALSFLRSMLRGLQLDLLLLLLRLMTTALASRTCTLERQTRLYSSSYGLRKSSQCIS